MADLKKYSYKILDGKETAASLRAELKKDIEEFAEKRNRRPPRLIIFQVGNNPASNTYVQNKIKACEEVGIKVRLMKLESSITEDELIQLIREVNSRTNESLYNGVFVQLPLPKHIDENRIIQMINPNQDVDGFSIENVGTLMLKHPKIDAFMPCTAWGIINLLQEYDIPIEGKHCVIVNRSAIVGKPLAMMLLQKDATVTICHSKTENLKEICQQADILITAIGKPKFFTKDYIKQNAIVIDVGMNRDEKGKLCGDVDFDDVIDKVTAITPVPGGVGPMTVTVLLYNVYKAWTQYN
jgi:methylenetetrahydrofolate dehydrogenase (NADP+)/methenyltetrahydrofolate cyclohydrolase